MSIEIVKKQIYRFLSSDNPEVIAIKGAWGIGKTYSWNKFLKNAKIENKIALEKYSYVSLFGINSLEAFKYSIFEQVVNKNNIGSEISIETFKENTTGILSILGRKSLLLFKSSYFLKNFTPAIDSLSFLSLNKTIICIDDIERKGSNLSIKDILGLITQLKEQKKCKVVLLLNENEDGLDEYIKYKEKTVDIELEFSPTAEECSEIAFDSNFSETAIEILKKHSQKLNIKNIRVLKKIERLASLAYPIIKNYEAELLDQMISSIVLYSWCYYKVNDDTPSLDFVIGQDFDLWGLSKEEKTDENKNKWKSLIVDYGYYQTDDFDLVIAEAIKTGYFIEHELKEKSEKKSKEISLSKAENSFSKVWFKCYESFDDNETDIINELYNSFRNNVKTISLSYLNRTVSLFKKLVSSH